MRKSINALKKKICSLYDAVSEVLNVHINDIYKKLTPVE